MPTIDPEDGSEELTEIVQEDLNPRGPPKSGPPINSEDEEDVPDLNMAPLSYWQIWQKRFQVDGDLLPPLKRRVKVMMKQY